MLWLVLHQPADEPLGNVLHIGGALLQVGILHPLELIDQPVTDELDRRDSSPVFLAHLVANGLDVARIVQQMQVDVEDGDRVLAVALAKPQCQALQIVAHLLHRHIQPFQLSGVILILARGDGVELLAGPPHPGLGHGDAAGTGNTTQRLAPVGLLQPALGLGLGDPGRQLGRQGHHEGLFPLIEEAALLLLHHQNAHHLTLMHDGGAEEGAKCLFGHIGQELEAGMGGASARLISSSR